MSGSASFRRVRKSSSPHVNFSQFILGADRLHYVNAEDVRIVLSRLPLEFWQRLRTVHFNDRSHGARVFGYVNRGRRDIALCALPPRLSLRRVLVKGQTPAQFGAKPGHKWPVLAVWTRTPERLTGIWPCIGISPNSARAALISETVTFEKVQM